MLSHTKRIVRLVVILRNILIICYLSSYAEALPQRMVAMTVSRRVSLDHKHKDFSRSGSNQREQYQDPNLKTSEKALNVCTISGRDSDERINSETYCHFTFNSRFLSSKATFPPASEQQYWQISNIHTKVLNDEWLTMEERSIWLQVSTHLLFAYDDESGVIFYDFKKTQWQLCAQVGIYILFPHAKYSINMCVGLPITLLGIELPAITRAPIDSMDFLSDELIKEKKTLNGITTTEEDTVSRQVADGPPPEEEPDDAIYVDLLTSSIYTSNCTLGIS